MGIVAVLFIALTLVFIQNYEVHRVNVCAVGDILLYRGVRDRLIENGYDYPYERVKHILKKADIAFGNLECPLTDGGSPVLKRRDLIFKGDPDNACALKKAGFDVLNLANNHTMDYGRGGLVSTLNLLQALKIRVVGACLNPELARKPVFVCRHGSTIGFIGYTVFPPEGYIYSEDKPDVARVDEERMRKEIGDARKHCDFLVISFHWGKEYEFFASENQKKLAHAAVDSSASLVIGHHPHVLQGIEQYKGKLIFYSLGNFVFDKQIQKGTDETVILNLKVVNNRWEEAELIPIKIVNCQPRIATGSDGEHILKRLQMYSQGMNADILIKNGRGYLTNSDD